VRWLFDHSILSTDDQRSKVFGFDRTSAELDSIYVCNRTKKPSHAIVSLTCCNHHEKKRLVKLIETFFAFMTSSIFIHLYLINVYSVC
jgi:hypothetical protein